MIQGTVYNYITRILSDYPIYHGFCNQELSRMAYLQFLYQNRDELLSVGLDDDQMHLSSRITFDEVAKIDSILLDLKAAGIIDTIKYPKEAFEKFRTKVYEEYEHGNYRTYIFPDEERLIYALSQISRPRSAALLGSYYGYWGIWIMPAIQEEKGIAYFLDVDQNVNTLAKKNLVKMGFDSNATLITGDGVEFAHTIDTQFDFVVLDAEGPDNHPDPDYRGKAVYYPLTKAILPRLLPKTMMVTHNILVRNMIKDCYFENKIAKNKDELSKYLALTQQEFDFSKDYMTTEGTAVYQMP